MTDAWRGPAAAAAVIMAAAASALAAQPGAVELRQAVPLEASLERRLEVCASCHGADGISKIETVPSLAAQPEIFTTTQLILFRERIRKSEQMTPQARGLSDPEIAAISAYYAALPMSARAPGGDDPRLLERGRDLAARMRCGTCHLPDFTGRNQIPRLAGQREDYLAATMRAYRDDEHTGGDTLMTDVLRELSDDDIAALAHYLSRHGLGG